MPTKRATPSHLYNSSTTSSATFSTTFSAYATTKNSIMSYLPKHTFDNLEDLNMFVEKHGRALGKGRSKMQLCAVQQVPVEVFKDLDKNWSGEYATSLRPK